MKKLISYLFVLCVCTSLCACSVSPNKTTVSTGIPTISTEETTLPEQNTQIRQLPMYSISLPIITQTEYAADGTVLFNYSYQNIALIGPEQDVADAVIIDLLNQIDSTATDAASVKEYATEDYKIQPNWNPYFYELIFQPKRLDQSVLSLYGRNVTYSGGAHSMISFVSKNYDLTTGNILKLTDVLIDDTASAQLCDFVLVSLSQNEDAQYLYEGYEDSVKERFNKPLSKDQAWHFNSEGLVFHFSPYEIGPFSLGDVCATVPYRNLVGILKEAYFPLETEDASGKICADIFSEEVSSNFTQFSEIVLEENSKKFFLYTDDYVRDITLYTGSWSDISGAFGIGENVFYATNLTPGDAIMVETELNTEIPSLYLTYSSNGQTITKLVMLDKQTNNIKLIDG